MSTHKENPYQQKVDQLLREKADAEKRQERARTGYQRKAQEAVEKHGERLGAVTLQMAEALSRVDAPLARLGENGKEGWMLGGAVRCHAGRRTVLQANVAIPNIKSSVSAAMGEVRPGARASRTRSGARRYVPR